MPYPGLFDWWIATITWSIAFPIVVSVYLYSHRISHKPASKGSTGLNWLIDFAFIWFLLGLLAFYVVTVSQGSSLLFAAGNIVVEVLLLAYVVGFGGKGSPTERETSHPR